MTDVSERWVNHPLVEQAIEKADGDPLLVLEKLSETLNDLEERFPGLTFDQILQPTRRYDKRVLKSTLMREGYCEKEANSILGIGKP